MKAIILAGGLGTRLNPLTVNLPKPMVPVANRPLMAYVLELLASHGIKEVSILLYHLPQMIREHFADGRQLGLKLRYVVTPRDLGTAGAVRFAANGASEPVLVFSADLLTDINLTHLIDFHRRRRAEVTMALVKSDQPQAFGVVTTDESGRVVQFLEKPGWSEVFSDTINAGIYVLEPEALRAIPVNEKTDFSYDLFPKLLESGRPVFGFTSGCYWSDLGRLADYHSANLSLLNGQPNLVGADCEIAADAKLNNAIIGGGCRIGSGAELNDSVVWDNVEVGSGARLDQVVVGRGVKIGARVSLGRGTVVGDDTLIEDEVEIPPQTKIWPCQIIQSLKKRADLAKLT